MRYIARGINTFMEEKELIEKLKDVSRISAESAGYRVKLRIALLTAHESIRKSQKISIFAWRIIPASALALIVLVLGISQEPSLSLKSIGTISAAKQILEYDAQTESLMASGAIIEDTKIIGDKAYIVMRLPKEANSEMLSADKAMLGAPMASRELNYQQSGKNKATEEKIYLVEIDLTDKRVANIKEGVGQKEAVPNK